MFFPITLPCPPDGFEQFEKAFLKFTIIDIYYTLDDPKDKFILMAIKEMGYPEEVVGKMMGITQEAVSNRLKKITEILYGKGFNNNL